MESVESYPAPAYCCKWRLYEMLDDKKTTEIIKDKSAAECYVREQEKNDQSRFTEEYKSKFF